MEKDPVIGVLLFLLYMKSITMNSIAEIQDKQYESLLKEHSQSLREYIIEVSNKAQAEGKDVADMIDEGILGSLVGGIIGGTAGKSIMQAVCKALGVDERSPLGQLLTSRLVLTAVGAHLGYKW